MYNMYISVFVCVYVSVYVCVWCTYTSMYPYTHVYTVCIYIYTVYHVYKLIQANGCIQLGCSRLQLAEIKIPWHSFFVVRHGWHESKQFRILIQNFGQIPVIPIFIIH